MVVFVGKIYINWTRQAVENPQLSLTGRGQLGIARLKMEEPKKVSILDRTMAVNAKPLEFGPTFSEEVA